jgi:hypothetical protein
MILTEEQKQIMRARLAEVEPEAERLWALYQKKKEELDLAKLEKGLEQLQTQWSQSYQESEWLKAQLGEP